MKNRYLKFCDYVAKACGAFAVLALLLSILVIVELVFERYFFQRAITWQTELVTMLLVASTFIGSAYVLSEKAHVSMEWIYDFLSKTIENRFCFCSGDHSRHIFIGADKTNQKRAVECGLDEARF